MTRARIRRIADERTRERARVPLAYCFAPHDLPLVAVAHHIVLVTQREREVRDRTVGWLHVVANDPRLDERLIADELDVLVAFEMHRRGIHEQSRLESVQVVVERA